MTSTVAEHRVSSALDAIRKEYDDLNRRVEMSMEIYAENEKSEETHRRDLERELIRSRDANGGRIDAADAKRALETYLISGIRRLKNRLSALEEEKRKSVAAVVDEGEVAVVRDIQKQEQIKRKLKIVAMLTNVLGVRDEKIVHEEVSMSVDVLKRQLAQIERSAKELRGDAEVAKSMMARLYQRDPKLTSDLYRRVKILQVDLHKIDRAARDQEDKFSDETKRNDDLRDQAAAAGEQEEALRSLQTTLEVRTRRAQSLEKRLAQRLRHVPELRKRLDALRKQMPREGTAEPLVTNELEEVSQAADSMHDTLPAVVVSDTKTERAIAADRLRAELDAIDAEYARRLEASDREEKRQLRAIADRIKTESREYFDKKLDVLRIERARHETLNVKSRKILDTIADDRARIARDIKILQERTDDAVRKRVRLANLRAAFRDRFECSLRRRSDEDDGANTSAYLRLLEESLRIGPTSAKMVQKMRLLAHDLRRVVPIQHNLETLMPSFDRCLRRARRYATFCEHPETFLGTVDDDLAVELFGRSDDHLLLFTKRDGAVATAMPEELEAIALRMRDDLTRELEKCVETLHEHVVRIRSIGTNFHALTRAITVGRNRSNDGTTATSSSFSATTSVRAADLEHRVSDAIRHGEDVLRTRLQHPKSVVSKWFTFVRAKLPSVPKEVLVQRDIVSKMMATEKFLASRIAMRDKSKTPDEQRMQLSLACVRLYAQWIDRSTRLIKLQATLREHIASWKRWCAFVGTDDARLVCERVDVMLWYDRGKDLLERNVVVDGGSVPEPAALITGDWMRRILVDVLPRLLPPPMPRMWPREGRALLLERRTHVRLGDSKNSDATVVRTTTDPKGDAWARYHENASDKRNKAEGTKTSGSKITFHDALRSATNFLTSGPAHADTSGRRAALRTLIDIVAPRESLERFVDPSTSFGYYGVRGLSSSATLLPPGISASPCLFKSAPLITSTGRVPDVLELNGNEIVRVHDLFARDETKNSSSSTKIEHGECTKRNDDLRSLPPAWTFQCLIRTSQGSGTILVLGTQDDAKSKIRTPLRAWPPRTLSLHVKRGFVVADVSSLRRVEGKSSVTVVGRTCVADGLWHRVALTFDASRAKSLELYVDGCLEGSDGDRRSAAVVRESDLPLLVLLGGGTDPSATTSIASSPAGLFAGDMSCPTLRLGEAVSGRALCRDPVRLLPFDFSKDSLELTEREAKAVTKWVEDGMEDMSVCPEFGARSDVGTNFGRSFSLFCEIKTTRGGPIVSKTADWGRWRRNNKSLFVVPDGNAFGTVAFCIGKVGLLHGTQSVCDGMWHRIGVTHDRSTRTFRIYVDGRLDAEKTFGDGYDDDDLQWKLKIGSCSDNFPRGARVFVGVVRHIRLWTRVILDGSTEADAHLDDAVDVVTPSVPPIRERTDLPQRRYRGSDEEEEEDVSDLLDKIRRKDAEAEAFHAYEIMHKHKHRHHWDIRHGVAPLGAGPLVYVDDGSVASDEEAAFEAEEEVEGVGVTYGY